MLCYDLCRSGLIYFSFWLLVLDGCRVFFFCSGFCSKQLRERLRERERARRAISYRVTGYRPCTIRCRKSTSNAYIVLLLLLLLNHGGFERLYIYIF